MHSGGRCRGFQNNSVASLEKAMIRRKGKRWFVVVIFFFPVEAAVVLGSK